MMESNETTQRLEELERRYWQAIMDRDARMCAELSSDPCVVTGAQGVGTYTRDQLREMMEQQKQYTLEGFALKDMQVHMLGSDTAAVAYVVHEELIVDGQPLTLDAADSSIWVRQNDEWTCALHTEAILGDPFGRDRMQAPAQGSLV